MGTALLAAPAFVFILSMPVFAQSSSRLAQTDKGPVIGTQDGSVSAFLGIPFAAAPVGDLRFRPPQPHAAWTTPFPATSFGPPCPQGASLQTPSLNEDCLTLNVFQPVGGGDARPVLVFLFGGSFKAGSAGTGGPNGPNYDGSRIAARTGDIVVTVNYRLGALGFLALPALDAESPNHVSGNYGLLDQQAALRWVADNAPYFGGDPKQVTLFGQSAGALSIVEQMVSPPAQGLFAGVELESVGALPSETLAKAEKRDAPILSQTGCSTAADQVACLRAAPVAALVASTIPVGPNVDGVVIPTAPNKALSAGNFAQVPVLLGSNLNEGTFFIAAAAGGQAVTEQQLQQTLDKTFGTTPAAAILAQYPASTYGTPGQVLSAILTDEFFSCPASDLVQVLAGQVPVEQYEFSQPNPIFNFPVSTAPGIADGDPHTSELAYVFGHDGAGNPLPSGPNRTLSDAMIDVLGIFSREGSTRLLPDVGSASVPVIELTTPIQASTTFEARHQCGFWQSAGIAPALITKLD
jgi:para-nitrobenzyl esterase